MSRFELRSLLTRRFWEPITRSLFLMATGAYALAIYVAAQDSVPSADQLADTVQIIWWVLLLVWSATTPRQGQGSEVKDPTPARSGTLVVLATGLGAAFLIARDATRTADFILPAAVLLATGVVALFVYRFATKHAHEIGEARFQALSTPRKTD